MLPINKRKKQKRKNAFLLTIAIIFIFNASLHAMANNGFDFYNYNLEEDNIINYEGIKCVFVYAIDCPACKTYLETVKQLDENYSNYSITFFAMDANNTEPENNQSLIDYKQIANLPDDWVQGYAKIGSLYEYNIQVVPFTIIYDKHNNIVAVISGSANYDYLEKRLEYAINEETEKYETKPSQDATDFIKVVFIFFGIVAVFITGYFLYQSNKKTSSIASIIAAQHQLKTEEQDNESQDQSSDDPKH